MTNVAFIGLGAMGSRMAGRLVAAGHHLRVFNRTAKRAQDLVAAGASLADTPADAARGAEVVISMVRDDEASRSVWLDPETGALAGIGDGVLAIECSTLSPTWTRELAAAVEKRDARFVDAPVVGTRPHAEAGQLAFLAGGDGTVVDELRPLFLAMGAKVLHNGPVGTGTAMKLAVNALFAIQAAAMGEALAMLANHDVPLETAHEILSALPVTSPAAAGVGALMVAGTFAPMFPIELVEKDLRYAEATSNARGGSIFGMARELYGEARTAGHGDENVTAIFRLFR